MSTPRSDMLYVRASMHSGCNLDCIYCPRNGGMEDRTPEHLQSAELSTADYLRNLSRLARNGLRGISFTGGEPTLNPSLPEFVQFAGGLFERVELTTNGYAAGSMLAAMIPYLSTLKVSLDTLDSSLAHVINGASADTISRAVDVIHSGCEHGLRVGVNIVAMRSILPGLDSLIQMVSDINANGYPGQAYVSILDFYYSEERRQLWEREFVPLTELEALFGELYGTAVEEEKFGCRFVWYHQGRTSIRLKDSFHRTLRGDRCHNCPVYCQEGIYSVMHSTCGWVTYCPTSRIEFGFELSPKLTEERADELLSAMLTDVRLAEPDSTSFARMLDKHDLHPLSLSRQRHYGGAS